MSWFGIGLWLFMAQDRATILSELESYDTRIETVQQQVTALQARSGEIAATRQQHADALSKAEADLTARRQEAVRRVHALYRLKRRGIARLLFDAESPAELRRRVRYLLAVVRGDEQRTHEFVAAAESTRAAAARLDADAAAVASVQADLAGQLQSLTTERAKRAALLRQIRTTPGMAARVLQERTQAASALGASMAAVEATAPVAPTDAAAFRSEKGRLPLPVGGALVRRFGPYVDPASGQPANNLGIDLGAQLGTPFRAVADGVVTRSGYLRGYGQMVMVQHGPYTTLYAHANGLRVSQGQSVHRGDVLGLVGNTGLAEDAEAQLHFEVRYNNTPQDPAEWLGGLR